MDLTECLTPHLAIPHSIALEKKSVSQTKKSSSGSMLTNPLAIPEQLV